jgi:hypothetical protein
VQNVKTNTEPQIYVEPKTAAEPGSTFYRGHPLPISSSPEKYHLCFTFSQMHELSASIADGRCGKPVVWFDYESGEKII